MTPYEALYHHKPSYGLISPDIPTNSCGEVLFLKNLPKDSYLGDISQPIPDGTRVFGSTSLHLTMSCAILRRVVPIIVQDAMGSLCPLS